MKPWLIATWSVVKVRLGFKPPVDNIPEGMYCYRATNLLNGGIKVKLCPYYMVLRKESHNAPGINACKYLGTITTDYLLNDQCKICGENNE